MKATLLPVYFRSGEDQEFLEQCAKLRELLAEEAEILPAVPFEGPLPLADAILFPQVLGDAYQRVHEIEKIPLPILVVTSEFGTVNMWDWEIVSYLRNHGVKVFAPYTPELTKSIVRSLALKRELQKTVFLVFQDNPGEGMQASIFKRFFWWENECAERMKEKFGVTITKKSFKMLAERAKTIPDYEVEKVWEKWNLPGVDLSPQALRSALKLYLAVKEEIAVHPAIRGVSMNCLNESFYSDTTPCLTWCMLFEEKELIWGCEGDTLSLFTKFVVYHALRAPVFMSNVYPFLMGQAALKHERIDSFPQVNTPEDHLLIAHCGYFGLMPPSFASEWTVRPPVLAIVNQNAHAVDARFPQGPVTLVKLDSSLSKILLVKGNLEGYVQYPGSDCRNGGIVRVGCGHMLMERLPSHHVCLVAGDHSVALRNVAKCLDLEIEEVGGRARKFSSLSLPRFST